MEQTLSTHITSTGIEVAKQKMPGIAHSAVNSALSLGISTLEWTKSKDGSYLKWAVEKVEAPAKYTLESRLGQTVLKVSDSCLTLADNTIESALNTSTFKSCEALVKTTYSNKLRPVVTNTAGVVVNTTSRVTTPVGKIYFAALAIADRQVDYFLPGDKNETQSKPTIIGLTRKVTRRTGRRIYVAKEWTVTKVTNVSNGVMFTVKQAHPVNVVKNVKALYWIVLVRADNLVDSWLPDSEDHSPQPQGPVSLASKIVRRSVKRTAAGVRAAATAIRKLPSTFKAVARSAVASAKAARSRTVAAVSALVSYDYRSAASSIVTYDYRSAASSRALAILSAADRTLQRYRLTAALRNFVEARFGFLVRSLLRARPAAERIPAVATQLPQPSALPSANQKPAESKVNSAAKGKESPAPAPAPADVLQEVPPAAVVDAAHTTAPLPQEALRD